MTLYTSSTLGVNWRWALDDLLMTDMATWLRWFDIPVPGAQLEHLGAMARSFIGAMVNHQPHPRGLVPQLAESFGTSRQTIYTIGERIDEGVFVRPNGRRPAQVNSPEPVVSPSYAVVTVTPHRVQRTVLTNLLPGGMSIRPQIESLQTALDTHRCKGWISELIVAAGERAGRQLDEVDLSALGQVVTARDELYFDGKVFLIHVEPRHFVIVGA